MLPGLPERLDCLNNLLRHRRRVREYGLIHYRAPVVSWRWSAQDVAVGRFVRAPSRPMTTARPESAAGGHRAVPTRRPTQFSGAPHPAVQGQSRAPLLGAAGSASIGAARPAGGAGADVGSGKATGRTGWAERSAGCTAAAAPAPSPAPASKLRNHAGKRGHQPAQHLAQHRHHRLHQPIDQGGGRRGQFASGRRRSRQSRGQ